MDRLQIRINPETMSLSQLVHHHSLLAIQAALVAVPSEA
jgi:hypothetical protein